MGRLDDELLRPPPNDDDEPTRPPPNDDDELLRLGLKVLRGVLLKFPPLLTLPLRPPPKLVEGAETLGRVTVLRVLLSRRPKPLPLFSPLPFLREPNEVLLPLPRDPNEVLGRAPTAELLLFGLPMMGGRRAVPNCVALLGLPLKPLPKSPRWNPSRMPW